MNKKIILYSVTFLISVFMTITSSIAQESQFSIEGSYVLVSRELPDGTMQGSPDIMGMMTYTKKFRNFNILLKDDNGKFFSFSVVSEYTLTEDEYTEKVLFSITNNESSGKGINYDVSGKSGSSDVSTKNGKVKFKPPFDSPTITLDGNKITAEGKDFVDVWEKVE